MRKQRMLSDRLRKFKGIDLKTHEVRLSRLEAIFSRGDRRLGQIIESAWRKGARFDEWSDHFREEHWNNSFRDCDLDPEQFLPALPTEAALIWDHIDSRVNKEFLLKDLKKGLASRFWHPCEKPYSLNATTRRATSMVRSSWSVTLRRRQDLKATLSSAKWPVSAAEIVVERSDADRFGRDKLLTFVPRETANGRTSRVAGRD
jgi:hypothetical protein